MATPRHKPRFWRICRIYFRRFRLTVWFTALVLLTVLLYLNQIGLPNFVKEPLLEELRDRGIELQFSRLRLRWYQGIVAENVRFGHPDDPLSPQLTLKEVQVRLNARALARLQLQVDSLALHQGRLVWPLAESNQGPRQLSVENIHTELRLLPNDQWALDQFTAGFAGANIRLSGMVTNASAVRQWKRPRQEPGPRELLPNRLRRLAETLERIHFGAPPELNLDIQGDARDLQSFALRIVLSAPDAETPWGTISRGRFTARLFPAASNEVSRAELNLEAADAQTRWAAVTNLHLDIRLVSVAGQSNLVSGDLTLSAQQAHTQWGGGSHTRFSAQWVHAITNPIPLSGQGHLQCEQAHTTWGNAGKLQFVSRLETPPTTTPTSLTDSSWGWWTNLQPYLLDWECRLTDLQVPQLQAHTVVCSGSWQAPQLLISNLQVRLASGQLQAHAGLDVATRALNVSLTSDLDPHQISPLLTKGACRWLEQFSWNQPPQVKGELSLMLPAWTNRQPDWRVEVQPTLRLLGEAHLEHGGAYRLVPIATAHTHFAYSNMSWHLPDLRVTRPEGHLEAEHRANDRTRDFYWRLHSTIDPRILSPILEVDQQRVLDLFTFSQPPVLDGEVWGRYHDHERIGLSSRVALTNFTFRGETASGLQATLNYTNRLLQVLEPRLQRGTQHVSAAGLLADFTTQKLYLTNGFSTADPSAVTRAIGPHIAKVVEPYQFSLPPTARVYGTIPLRHEADADLHFEIEGGTFHWWKFTVPYLAGHVHWQGSRLTLTDVRTEFYQGNAVGAAVFDFTPEVGTDFQFSLTTTNTLLQALMADLSTRTNHLEGRLSATLVVTHANTENWRSVCGYGDMDLQDGLIWDIPVFGIFTPVLDSISPGLGHSRASAGTCSYVITNGVFRTDNLEIRAPAMRLVYRGTADLQQQVNARVEAEFLRDMWLVGPLVSTVFWPVTKMFEYKVTGSMEQPNMQPVYLIPKLMLLPFHPFRTLKSLVPGENNSNRPNAPPR